MEGSRVKIGLKLLKILFRIRLSYFCLEKLEELVWLWLVLVKWFWFNLTGILVMIVKLWGVSGGRVKTKKYIFSGWWLGLHFRRKFFNVSSWNKIYQKSWLMSKTVQKVMIFFRWSNFSWKLFQNASLTNKIRTNWMNARRRSSILTGKIVFLSTW